MIIFTSKTSYFTSIYLHRMYKNEVITESNMIMAAVASDYNMVE